MKTLESVEAFPQVSTLNDVGIGEYSTYAARIFKRDLPSPLYWTQISDRRFLYNVRLLRNLYLACGGDRNHPEHQKLVEEYISSVS